MKGNIIFKNPENETVNMNFLVMLTSDAWAEKLAAAYKAWKGEEIDLGSYKNAGYKWIAEFLSNCTLDVYKRQLYALSKQLLIYCV